MSDIALTRDFNETVRARLARDDEFARALLDEAATLYLDEEPHTARLILLNLVEEERQGDRSNALSGNP